jgi:hypothetical protein
MAFVAGGVAVRQRKIVSAFRTAGATSPDRATAAALVGVKEGLAFRILRRHEILREVGPDRLYLDESRWEEHRSFRRRMLLMVVVVLFAVFLALFLWIMRG